MKNWYSRITAVGFLILFLPILFCLFAFGNNMDYFDVVKQNTLVHNFFLLPICILGLLIVGFLKKPLNKIEVTGSRPRNLIVVLCIALFYLGTYVINIKIAKCIAFYSGWDMSIVTGAVYQLSEGKDIADNVLNYYKIFPNNAPITYVLYKLFQFAKEKEGYPYNIEFIWIQASCLMVSLAGFFTTMTARKITKKMTPTLVSMLIFTALISLSPWKVIPYTDILSVAFGIFILYFYACYREIESPLRYLLWLAICFFGLAGGVFKATAYVPLIAILATEAVRILMTPGWREKLKELLVIGVLLGVSVAGVFAWRGHAYKVIGYEPDASRAVTWHHYLRMGLNEYSTGGYNSEYYQIINEYIDRPVSERHAEEIRQVREALRERGLIGTIYFYLRKSVMNYNDGSFSWYMEGNFHFQEYQDISQSSFKPLLREIYWYDGKEYRLYLTCSQLAWLFTLLLLPGTAVWLLCKKGEEEGTDGAAAILMTLIGATLFVMLFEGRARYLLNLAPIYVAAASISFDLVAAGWRKQRPEQR